jgi:hypothetical protein
VELNPPVRKKLKELCHQSIENPDLLSKVLRQVGYLSVIDSASLDLKLQLHKESQESEVDSTLQRLVSALTSNASRDSDDDIKPHQHKTIRFPYSRHSSYSELCELVGAFRPGDVFPCTVDEAAWTPEIGMRALFGDYCSSQTFRQDAWMMPIFTRNWTQQSRGREGSESHSNTQSAQPNTQFENPPASTFSYVSEPVAPSKDVERPQAQRKPYVPILKQLKQLHSQNQLYKQSSELTVVGVTEPMINDLDTKKSQVLPNDGVDEAKAGWTTGDFTGEQSAPQVALSMPPKLAIAAETYIEDVLEQPQVLPDVKADEVQVEETVIINLTGEKAALNQVPAESATKAESPTSEVSIPFASIEPRQLSLEEADSRPRKKRRYKNATLAYLAGKSTLREDTLLTWADFGGLVSTRTNETKQEDIL